MRSPLRLLALTLVVTLAAVGSAQAVIIGAPEFTLSPFTKAQTGAGNVVTATLIWLPPTFCSDPGTDKQEVTDHRLSAGAAHQTFSAGPTTSSFPLMLVRRPPVLDHRRRLPDRDLHPGRRRHHGDHRDHGASTPRRRAAPSRSTTARWRPTTGT